MHSDVESFLQDIKELIKASKRRFVKRKGRDYRQDLIDLGFDGSIDKAWNMMRTIKGTEMSKPPELDEDGSGKLIWFFQKKMPNGIYAYIKLTIDERGCVCISCHPVDYGENAR